jgi:uncharacterized protein YfaP (DUF2135 family)
MDLYVHTPTGKVIWYGNQGPGPETDNGQQDMDDTVGPGPENIFWAAGVTPPSGSYLVCANPFGLWSSTNITVVVNRPGHSDQTFTGSFTPADNNQGVSDCTEGSASYLGTVIY